MSSGVCLGTAKSDEPSDCIALDTTFRQSRKLRHQRGSSGASGPERRELACANEGVQCRGGCEHGIDVATRNGRSRGGLAVVLYDQNVQLGELPEHFGRQIRITSSELVATLTFPGELRLAIEKSPTGLPC